MGYMYVYIYIVLSMSNQPFSNIQPTLQLQHFRSSSVKWCCERHGEFELWKLELWCFWWGVMGGEGLLWGRIVVGCCGWGCVCVVPGRMWRYPSTSSTTLKLVHSFFMRLVPLLQVANEMDLICFSFWDVLILCFDVFGGWFAVLLTIKGSIYGWSTFKGTSPMPVTAPSLHPSLYLLCVVCLRLFLFGVFILAFKVREPTPHIMVWKCCSMLLERMMRSNFSEGPNCSNFGFWVETCLISFSILHGLDAQVCIWDTSWKKEVLEVELWDGWGDT